jgi:NADP-dependent 3-hydroxy acid dehydrogenase YdfG
VKKRREDKMSASNRANQIAGHLNYPKGMLAGQVAIITGSGQGIGAECARLFANEGARVVVADVDGGELSLSLSKRTRERANTAQKKQTR